MCNVWQVLEDLQARIALLQARPSMLDEFMAYSVMHSQQVRQAQAHCTATAENNSQSAAVDWAFE